MSDDVENMQKINEVIFTFEVKTLTREQMRCRFFKAAYVGEDDLVYLMDSINRVYVIEQAKEDES